jgi:chromosome segregation ATPase
MYKVVQVTRQVTREPIEDNIAALRANVARVQAKIQQAAAQVLAQREGLQANRLAQVMQLKALLDQLKPTVEAIRASRPEVAREYDNLVNLISQMIALLNAPVKL